MDSISRVKEVILEFIRPQRYEKWIVIPSGDPKKGQSGESTYSCVFICKNHISFKLKEISWKDGFLNRFMLKHIMDYAMRLLTA